MAANALNSADELNIDGFFSRKSIESTVASESDEDKPDTSEDAPDKKIEAGKEQVDDDLEEDADLEDELDPDDDDDDSGDDDSDDLDDSEEDKKAKPPKKKEDDSKELSALEKKANHAEFQRSQMQSERDTWKAQAEKANSSVEAANSNIEALTKKVEQLTKLTEQLTKKTEQSDLSDILSGDDDDLVTYGKIRKLFEKQTKLSQPKDEISTQLTEDRIKQLISEHTGNMGKDDQKQSQPAKIGSDQESEQLWANSQSDVVEVTNYYVKHKNSLDPELATVPTYSARYATIQAKMLASELDNTKSDLATAKKALRKAKQKIKRMGKGELPETASGVKPPTINDKQSGDPLIDYLTS
jgi:hypothetical protein